MSNPLDTDAGSEMFASYESELKLVQADLNQKLDQIAEVSGEQRKSAIRSAEQVLDEATELVRHPSVKPPEHYPTPPITRSNSCHLSSDKGSTQ